jgi:hypothetical protein
MTTTIELAQYPTRCSECNRNHQDHHIILYWAECEELDEYMQICDDCLELNHTCPGCAHPTLWDDTLHGYHVSCWQEEQRRREGWTQVNLI